MLNNRAEFIVYRQEAEKDYAAQAKKIIVFKYKPKKGSKTKQGHRQPYTKVKIEKINA